MPEVYLILIVVIICFVSSLALIRWWIVQNTKNNQSDELVAWLKSSSNITNAKLDDSMREFNTRLDNAASVIASVQKNIGEFSEIGRSMKDLQDFLHSPKLRGNIGEQILADLLAQHFPPDSYALQYSFRDGSRVDAILKTSSGLIPVDAKFPMENFRKIVKADQDEDKKQAQRDFVRDVKKHMSDIARKYIVPAEGTTDYTLMYVPAEAMYYEIITNSELYDYASSMRVLPVSPMSFYAYIKAILMSYEGQKIQSQAREILQILQSMKKEYEKTEESMQTVQRHLGNATGQMAQLTQHFGALGRHLDSTSRLQLKDQKPITKRLET